MLPLGKILAQLISPKTQKKVIKTTFSILTTPYKIPPVTWSHLPTFPTSVSRSC